jgi:hypothetical protein
MTVSLVKPRTIAAAEHGDHAARRALAYANAAIVRAKFTAPPTPAPARTVTAMAPTVRPILRRLHGGTTTTGLRLVGPHGTVEVEWAGGALHGRVLTPDATERGAFTCAEFPAWDLRMIADMWREWDRIDAALFRAYGSAFDVSVSALLSAN